MTVLMPPPPRDGKVTFEEELGSSSSYFQMRNLGTLFTSKLGLIPFKLELIPMSVPFQNMLIVPFHQSDPVIGSGRSVLLNSNPKKWSK